ncbi:MAG: DUF1571 domain-containing protein [Isosphaeraceae bacterium]
MVSAFLRSRGMRLRGVGLTLVALTALSHAGCARLLAFRSPNFPAAEESVATRGERQTSSDLYAQRVGRSKDSAPVVADRSRSQRSTRSDASTALASATQPQAEPTPARPKAETSRPTDMSDAGPAVALQSPVTLPAFTTSASPRTETKLVEPAAPSPEPAATPEPAVAAVASTSAPAREASRVSDQKAVEDPLAGLDRVLSASRKALDALSTYQVKMNHQERVNNRLNPAEDVLLSIRRQPKAVRIEWQEGPNKGREVLYAADARGGQMHVKMGGPIALPRLSMSPDSPMARRNSRHPIYEAGFDTIIANMEEGLAKSRAGDASGGRMAYAGQETPEGLDRPCHKITREMPTGERWVVYIDPQSNLPVHVQESAPNGDLLERYIFTNPTLNVADLSRPDAFDPDARWGEAKGLLSRLARSAASTDENNRPR